MSGISLRGALLLGAAIASAIAVGFGVGRAQAADPRLDTADAALVQAQNLVAASQAGEVSPKAQKQFDKAVANAIADITAARTEIAAAKAAADNP